MKLIATKDFFLLVTIAAVGLGLGIMFGNADVESGALGYATAMQVEDSQPVANAGSAGIGLDLIGVSSAHANQHGMEPQGVPYFPDGYVNQARDRYEHIQAF